MPITPLLGYVTSVVSTAPFDPGNYDLMTGSADIPTAAHVRVSVLGNTGLAPSTVPVQPAQGEWATLTQGSWVGLTQGPTGFQGIAAQNLSPEILLNAAAPYNTLIQQQAPLDPAMNTLNQLVQGAAINQNLTKQLAASKNTSEFAPVPVRWTAAPAPHWATVAAQGASLGPDSDLLPEIAFRDDYMRIGMVAFINAVGPLDLHVSMTPQLDIKPVLRRSMALKRLGSAVRKTVQFRMIFADELAITTELVPFLRQMKRAPFVPVIHSGLVHEHNITALAIASVSAQTVPMQPEAIEIQVTAYPFPGERFLLDGGLLDEAFNYPLLELWLSADERYNSIAEQTVQNQQPDTATWNSLLTLATPSRDWLDLINDNQTPSEQALTKSFLQVNSAGVAQDLGEIGANALDPDPQTAATALSALTESTNPAAAALPVFKATNFTSNGAPYYDSSGNLISGTISGPFVAFKLTDASAQYAFADPKYGGATYLLKEYNFTPTGLTGTIVSDALRSQLSTNSSSPEIAQSGEYLALWRQGGRAITGVGTDPKAFQPSDALRTAAQVQQLDPTVPTFELGVALDGFTIESVSAGMANSLAELCPTDTTTPEYQHLGSQDVFIEFQGVMTLDAVQQMYDVMGEISSLAHDYRGTQDGKAYGGYCKLDNEIAKIFGLQYAIPFRITLDNLENQPDAHRVSLSFMLFDPSQHKVNLPSDFSESSTLPSYDTPEHLAGSNGTGVDQVRSFDDFLRRVSINVQTEDVVRRIELYPDIQPPTWQVLTQWMADIQAGNVWNANPDVDEPYPNYSFLQSWPYTPEWLAQNAPGFLAQALPIPANTVPPPGYADPNFYCCDRSDPTQPTGETAVNNVLTSLYGDAHTAVFSGTDGASFSVVHGTPGIQVGPDARTYASLASVIDSAQGTTLTNAIANTDKTGLPPVLGVPESARNTESAIGVPGAVIEPDPTLGFGPTGPVVNLSSNAAYYGAFSPNWNFTNQSNGYYQKAAAVLSAARMVGVPPVLAANLMQTESDNANPLDTSSADAQGPVQITKANFPEYFRKAVHLGYIQAGTTPNFNDLTQLSITGMLVYREYYNHGLTLLATDGLSNAELQYYAWIYATASYNAGESGSGLRNYLKTGGDPRQMEANIVPSSTRTSYVPNVFGRGTRVNKAPITVSSFSPVPAAPPANTKPTTPPAVSVAAASNALATSGLTQDNTVDSDFPSSTPADPITGVSSTSGAAVPSTNPNTISIGNDVAVVAGTATLDGSGQGYEQIHSNRVWDYDRAAYDPEHGEDLFYAMRRSNYCGSLLRAFPTSCVLLVDGGRWIGFTHLVDTFYGLHSTMDIMVTSSRLFPQDTAVVSFADPYNNLSATAEDVALNKANSTQLLFDVTAIYSGMQSLVGPNNDIAARRAQELTSVLVKPGNRLHIRLGYGSNASELPTVFNGVISEVVHQDDILTVTGLGDGVELTSQLSPADGDGAFYQNVGGMGGGKEIRNIILDILATGDAEDLARFTGGLVGATNPYGVEHFGDVRRLLGVADTSEIGINIYSGWGDQPINITIAAEDGPLGLIAEVGDLDHQVIDQITGAISSYFNPKSQDYIDGMGMNKMFRCLQGEELVGIRMENATPWGVIDTLRKTCLDYVVSVEPFGLRSTLFFGKSWWPLHYRYEPGTLTGAVPVPSSSASSFDAFFNTANVEEFFSRRPFLQVHLAHSGINLIGSQISATQEGWSRSVQAIGSYAGAVEAQTTETSMVQFIDTDIYPQFQDMKLVQSGLYSTRNMRLHEGLDDVNPGEMLLLSTNVLNNFAVGQLHDEVREMYQGNAYVIGNGWIRPRHLMHLIDEMKQMAGLVEVKQVTHTLSLDGGFITTWQPDCVAYAQDTNAMMIATHACAFAARFYAIDKALKLAATAEGSAILRSGVASALNKWAVADERLGRAAGSPARGIEFEVTRLGRNLFDRTMLGQLRTKQTRATVTSDGITYARRDVLNLLDKVLGQPGNLKARHLRITQRFVRQPDYDRLLPQVQSEFAQLQQKLNGSPLSAEQRTIADHYVEATLTRNSGLFKAPFQKILQPSDSVAAELTPSNFRWLADRFATQPGMRNALLALTRNDDRVRAVNSKIFRNPVSRVSYQAYEKLLNLRDPSLGAVMKASLGGSGDYDAAIAKLESTIADTEASVAKLQARVNSGEKLGLRDRNTLAKGQKSLSSNKDFLSQLQKSRTNAAAVAKVGEGGTEAATAVKDASLLAGGAIKLCKVAAMIIIGAASSQFNRYLASRMAVKIIPLHLCGQEFTAGINGHLGAVVGDTLGPADQWLNAAFNLQNPSVPNKVVAWAFQLVLGIGNVHYGDDSSVVGQLMQSYGIPNAKDDRPGIVADRNKAQLRRLADLNTVGLLPGGSSANTPLGSTQLGTLGTRVPYTARSSSSVGQIYTKLVRDLSLLVGSSKATARQAVLQSGVSALQESGSDLTSGYCARRIQRVFAAEGGGTYYPQVAYARQLIDALNESPYSQYWQQVGSSMSVQQASQQFNGCLAVWGSRIGGGDGHVAILYNQGGQTYMLGNTNGDVAKNVTNLQGSLGTVDAIFMPR